MNASLRKAAILVSALDPPQADQLLDQMGEQQAARVRNAVMQLDDVDPAEQDAILAEFFGRPKAMQPEDDGGVELSLSSPQANFTPSARRESGPAAGRFQFLHDADGKELAQRLGAEHPQLLALVVAHLPAEKAAELIECLPAKLGEEVIERLSGLDDADPDVIAELEHTLERLFAGSTRVRPRSGQQNEHLKAILSHLRRESEPLGQQREPAMAASQPKLASNEPPLKISFEQLQSLSAAVFYEVFNEADPRVVMLALAGASRRLFERYLAQFSTDRALEFERHLEQLRPLRLRDVEAAQRELAIIAGRRLQTARTAAESSRRFAAAA